MALKIFILAGRGHPGAPPSPAFSAVHRFINSLQKFISSFCYYSMNSANSSYRATLLSSQAFPKNMIFPPPSPKNLCEKSFRFACLPVVSFIVLYLNPCTQKGVAFSSLLHAFQECPSSPQEQHPPRLPRNCCPVLADPAGWQLSRDPAPCGSLTEPLFVVTHASAHSRGVSLLWSFASCKLKVIFR